MLEEARAQRNRVNEGFLEANQGLERSHRGFGVNFWGSSWRFRLYDDLYTSAKDDNGAKMAYRQRYQNLKTRLAAIAQGKDPWLARAAAADQRIQKEVGNPEGLKLFCREWLALLTKEEERDAARAQLEAEAAVRKIPAAAERATVKSEAASDLAG
jgi:hypothetical protein